jgi:hypothetical protein
MRITIDIPEYKSETGIKLQWEEGFEITFRIEGGVGYLSGNKEGLLTLANHLLNISQDDAPIHSHIHLDQYGGLEDGSAELIIEKV